MILILLLFAAGLALIIKGGDWFVDAASWIARVSGIPPVIVGATVVSIATTLPELIVSLTAALAGKADIAIGNAVGSVTANTGLIMGFALFAAPFAFPRRRYAVKGLLMIAAIAVLLVTSSSGYPTDRGFAALLVILGLFVVENVRSSRRGESAREPHAGGRDILLHVAKFAGGIAAIILGADLLVENGSLLALALGVPEGIIGFTVIAIGTSLPELVTAVTCVRKKQVDLTVGNIIGANIIDTALILPLCAGVVGSPLPFKGESLYVDLPVCLIIALTALVPAIARSKFTRIQGALMMALYAAYVFIIVL